MRAEPFHALVCVAAVGFGVFFVSSQTAKADTDDVLQGLMYVCLGGGSEHKLETEGKVQLALTLRALRTGNLGADGGVAGKYTRSDWEGLVGGLSQKMTSLEAAEADKVRDCLAPYRASIVQMIIKSNE